MKKAIVERLRNTTVAVLGCALGLLVGCGDTHVFSLDPGSVDPGPTDGVVACLDGAEIELIRYSTLCERASSKSLVAEIGDGMEFSADQVRALESPCAEGPSPGVEIHVEHSSLIFDFSNVTGPGRFPKADFEGYMIDVALNEDSALLLAATIDTEANSIGLENADISSDRRHIEVNFEDLSYDERGFVKIHLWFASVVQDIQ